MHFESEVAGKSRFRWDKPKRRAETSSRVLFAYSCTCCVSHQPHGVSHGFTLPTVHGLDRVVRASIRRDG